MQFNATRAMRRIVWQYRQPEHPMHDRIAVRAYFLAQNDGYAQSAETYWLFAEEIELVQASLAAKAAEKAKRSEAAKRGAETRKRNAATRAAQHAASILAIKQDTPHHVH